MINQRIFLNVLDENRRPISQCRVKIENRREKYEADTDFAGIVEFLVPLGVYVLTLEHPLFKRKVYRMTLRDSFSFTRVTLVKDNVSTYRRNKIPMQEYIKNTEVDYDIYDNDEVDYDTYDNDEVDYDTYDNDKVDYDTYDDDKVDYDIDNVVNENSELQKNKKKIDIDEDVSVMAKANSRLDIKTDDEYKVDIEDNINIVKEYFKNGTFFKGSGIWGTAGVFEGLNDDGFEEIIKGAKSILKDIEGNSVWGTAGVFEGLNEEGFEEILKGAKSMLKDILDFAKSIDNEEYEVKEDDIKYESNLKEEPKLSDNYLKKRRKIDFDDSWEVEEIKGADKNYNGDTFDIDDYEEEIFHRIKEKEEY